MLTLRQAVFGDRETHLLQHGSTGGDLLDNLVIENGLSQNGKSLVLVFDAEFLGLHVDVDVTHARDTLRGLFCLLHNPAAKLVVAAGTVLSLGVFIFVKSEGSIEVGGKFLCTCLDSFLRNINSPFVVSDVSVILNALRIGSDTTSKLVITMSIECNVAVLICIGIAFCRSAVNLSVFPIFPGLFLVPLASGLLGGLVLLSLLWLVLQNEGAEFVARIRLGTFAASLARKDDARILGEDLGFRVFALLAQHELRDEAVEVVLEFACIVGTVDNPAVIGGLCVRLGTKFETEVLDDIYIKLAHTRNGTGWLR